MHVHLVTERLTLRRFTEADLDNLVELDSDPAVMRFLTGGRPTPREVVRDRILPGILAGYDRWDGFGRWAAVERAIGAFLGWIALHPVEGRDGDEVELGYRLRRPAWGRGYATEGSRAVVDRAFSRPPVPPESVSGSGSGPVVRRVFAETMAVNTASRRVMERVGLTYLRTFHLHWDDPIDGSERGEVEYELTRADWERRSSAGRALPG